MREKPVVNRDRLEREEERKRLMAKALEEAVRLLRPGETLGKPERVGSRIAIPVHRDRGGTPWRGGGRTSEASEDGYTVPFEAGVL